MAFEYLLESHKNAKNGNTIDPKPTNDLFCLNCGGTEINLQVYKNGNKFNYTQQLVNHKNVDIKHT